MNCPHCGTPNDPASVFCIKCGQALKEGSAPPAAPGTATVQTLSAAGLLGVYSTQAIVGLLVLLFFRSILVQLPFTQDFRLPDVRISTPVIITVVVYLIAIVILLSFARMLGGMWPQAFPRQAFLAPALTSLIYVAVLAAVYTAAKEPLVAFSSGDATLMLAVQGFCLVVAFILLVRSGVIIYQYLPAWLTSLRFEAPTSVTPGPK